MAVTGRRGVLTEEIRPGVGTAITFVALMGAMLATVWSAFLWHLPVAFVVMLWVIAVIIAIVGCAFDVVNNRGPSRAMQVGDPVTSWEAAEALAAAHMRAIGFSDARLTPRGADGGLDVVSRWCVAQVKYFAKPVGRPQIQGLRGAAHGYEHAFFYALTGFSPNAIEFADRAGVSLWQFDQRGAVWPVNAFAKRYRRPQPVDA